jgi:CheY-like chemotaxis protein
MTLRCLLVEDSPHFGEAASRLLERQGMSVAGVATTPADALARVRELRPDVTVIDVDLNGESGFDLAWRLADAETKTVLTSTRSESDFAELIAVTPTLGFVSKSDLSAEVIRNFLADRDHGRGCRHEALVYSSDDELAAGTVPFLRQGLVQHEHVLVILRAAGRHVLEQALGTDADSVAFEDATAWYRSPEHAFDSYARYVGERAERVRVVAEVVWPKDATRVEIAAWKRYEAGISGALAAVPVSFICAYDTRELPAEIIADAKRTHPILRGAGGARASATYMPPSAFLRTLD